MGGDAGAGGAQRVTEADGATVDVHLERGSGLLYLNFSQGIDFVPDFTNMVQGNA